MNIKASRKLQVHFEAKIRHAIATGPLPHIERGPTTETHSKQELDKTDGNGAGHSNTGQSK
jgi:hypothetical protein